MSESASPTDDGGSSGKRRAAGDEDDAELDAEDSDAEDTEDTGAEEAEEAESDAEEAEEADDAEVDDADDADADVAEAEDTEDDPTPAEPVGADEAAEPKRALPRTDDAAEGLEETESAPARRQQAVAVSAEAVAEPPEIAGSIAVTQESSPGAPTTPSVVTTTVAPPEVPSWRPWPTAYDLRTAVTYVVDLASSFVKALLQPFVSKPAAPSADPAEWALVAWIRREFFNQRPTPVENPLPYTQSLTLEGDVVVTGAVGFEDRDGDPLSYTVIGRPHNGGTVHVDQNGDFIYRPMNAMAAVGGTDSFTVVVSDERAGLQIGGLLGLLKFVPILGPLLYPSGGHRVAHTITVTVDPVAGVDLPMPDGFRWGVAHSGFQARRRPRFAGGHQLRLVPVGARSPQPAPRPRQRGARRRPWSVRLLRERRRPGARRTRREHLPDGHRVEPHIPELHCSY
ncbi:MAG: Ig-like domain-containing protein [Mycobacterium sp.]